MRKIYAGGGKRNAPPEVLEGLRRVAAALAKKGWTLRTGGAEGCDAALLEGAKAVGGEVEIYLPWPRFRGHEGIVGVTPHTMKVASHFHPRWESLSHGVRALHARNVAMLEGPSGESRADFFLVWAPAEDGGSGHAIRVARGLGIPVFNLGKPGEYRALREWLAREG